MRKLKKTFVLIAFALIVLWLGATVGTTLLVSHFA